LFAPTPEFVKDVYSKYPFLNRGVTTAIHIRRGDYLAYPNHHPVISNEYVNTVVSHCSSDHYLIISDDIQWCKTNLTIKNSTMLEENAWKSLWIMSLCKKFILSNSTFSWWGAYLCPHTLPQVFIPQTWFGEAYSGFSTKDIPMNGWQVVPSKIDSGRILPI